FGPSKTFYQERNRYLLLLKSLRWKTLVALTPGLLLAECVTWGFVLAKERRNPANKLRAYAWILRHWREIQAARRGTLARRGRSDRDLIAGCGYRLEFEQTGKGVAATLAHALLDPLFRACHRLALAVIRW
ncbi:MAG TPA: hypothetical protein VFZ25_09740, partial [Chloroflexota bacterium]|nr:hypothetical protein [Chloroflexota bacterium]